MGKNSFSTDDECKWLPRVRDPQGEQYQSRNLETWGVKTSVGWKYWVKH